MIPVVRKLMVIDMTVYSQDDLIWGQAQHAEAGGGTHPGLHALPLALPC